MAIFLYMCGFRNRWKIMETLQHKISLLCFRYVRNQKWLSCIFSNKTILKLNKDIQGGFTVKLELKHSFFCFRYVQNEKYFFYIQTQTLLKCIPKNELFSQKKIYVKSNFLFLRAWHCLHYKARNKRKAKTT